MIITKFIADGREVGRVNGIQIIPLGMRVMFSCCTYVVESHLMQLQAPDRHMHESDITMIHYLEMAEC